MKKLLFVLLLTLLLCGCSQVTPVAWMLSGTDVSSNDVQYAARVGVELENTEVGLASNYIRDATQNYGAYLVQFVANDPNGFPLLKRLYVGGQVTLDFDEDGGMYGPIVGTVEQFAGLDWVVELRYVRYNEGMAAILGDNEDELIAFVGPRIPIK